jgi:hypothetical protein
VKALYYTVTFLASLVILTAAGFETYIHWSEITALVDTAVTKPLSAGRHKKCKCDADCKCGKKCECNGTDKKCNPDCTCQPKPTPPEEKKPAKNNLDVK